MDDAMTDEESERRARADLMVLHLREAVRLGYSFATPGSQEAVRLAFPDWFATPGQQEYARNTYAWGSNENIEVDDHPLSSEGDKGVWVSAWVWLADRLRWTGPRDSDNEPCLVLNHYECDDCGQSWQMQWSCGCNDECPGCGVEIEPDESVDLDVETGLPVQLTAPTEQAKEG